MPKKEGFFLNQPLSVYTFDIKLKEIFPLILLFNNKYDLHYLSKRSLTN